MGEVLRDEDARVAFRRLGQADRRDGRQALLLEVSEDVELAAGDVQRLFLQSERGAGDVDEPDEMAGRPNRQLAELECIIRPVSERAIPGQIEQLGRGGAQTQAGE
jgi:hypothetical protein